MTRSLNKAISRASRGATPHAPLRLDMAADRKSYLEKQCKFTKQLVDIVHVAHLPAYGRLGVNLNSNINSHFACIYYSSRHPNSWVHGIPYPCSARVRPPSIKMHQVSRYTAHSSISSTCWRSIAHLAHGLGHPRSFAYHFTSASDIVCFDTSAFHNIFWYASSSFALCYLHPLVSSRFRTADHSLDTYM